MVRNSIEKSSIAVRELLHLVGEVIVEIDRRNRREQPDRGGDQRLGDVRARRPRDSWSRLPPICWKAVRMPHTVPNRPMNGVMLAVVARKVSRFSSRETSVPAARSSARSSASRLFSVGRGATAAGRPSTGAGAGGVRFELRGQLGIAGLEDADQRAVREVPAHGLHFRELAAAPEDVEEARRLPPRPLQLPGLVEDDAPGRRGKNEQNQQDALGERGRAQEQRHKVALRASTSRRGTLALEQRQDREGTRQRNLQPMQGAPLGQRDGAA